MKDFLKIFVAISSLVTAFMFGSQYGEKTYAEGAEYKNLIKAKTDLSFAKAELENVKAKLQNIIDQAEGKKTEEFLAQLLDVFFIDLGINIENKEAILKQAQKTVTPQPQPPALVRTESKTKPKLNINKFKSYEWMLQNSIGDKSTMKDLKKVQIKSLNSFLQSADDLDQSECKELLGLYKGSVKDINNNYYGSFEFELKSAQTGAKDRLRGKLAWYSETNKNPFSNQIENNCGKKIKGLSGRVFNVAPDKYVQIYKLNSVDKIASNLYEVLPNGTSKILGSFVLNRVDKF